MCYHGDVDYDILSCCHGNNFMIGMVIKVMIFCMLLYVTVSAKTSLVRTKI